MNRTICLACLAIGLTLLPKCVFAQDTRIVIEPVIPPVCANLVAQLSSSDSTLSASDESRPDTQRIQEAIDHCPQGQAVRLQANGALDAFLSGPLQLRTGVTILVDPRTVLFGSRNPRDYDLSAGSCGILDHQGHGCKALINGEHANNAAVMGEGTIDGRGWAKMLGQKKSWWDLAQEAKAAGSDQNCP
ncbi:MAG: hypothetical protein WBE12_17515, partial [Candidatus Acidiferrum sp.]